MLKQRLSPTLAPPASSARILVHGIQYLKAGEELLPSLSSPSHLYAKDFHQFKMIPVIDSLKYLPSLDTIRKGPYIPD